MDSGAVLVVGSLLEVVVVELALTLTLDWLDVTSGGLDCGRLSDGFSAGLCG